jgi:hypothetical protein
MAKERIDAFFETLINEPDDAPYQMGSLLDNNDYGSDEDDSCVLPPLVTTNESDDEANTLPNKSDDEAKPIRGGADDSDSDDVEFHPLSGIVNANYDPVNPPFNAANLPPRSQAYRTTLTNYYNPGTQHTPPDNNEASATEEEGGYNYEATAAEDEEEEGNDNDPSGGESLSEMDVSASPENSDTAASEEENNINEAAASEEEEAGSNNEAAFAEMDRDTTDVLKERVAPSSRLGYERRNITFMIWLFNNRGSFSHLLEPFILEQMKTAYSQDKARRTKSGRPSKSRECLRDTCRRVLRSINPEVASSMPVKLELLDFKTFSRFLSTFKKRVKKRKVKGNVIVSELDVEIRLSPSSYDVACSALSHLYRECGLDKEKTSKELWYATTTCRNRDFLQVIRHARSSEGINVIMMSN